MSNHEAPAAARSDKMKSELEQCIDEAMEAKTKEDRRRVSDKLYSILFQKEAASEVENN
jgi:hypothetical protein